MPDASPRAEGVDAAKLLLLLLSLAWGINWPVMKIALNEVSPWTMRIFGYGIGTVFLFALVRLRGQPLTLGSGRVWGHVLVSATLNVIGFGLLSAFAQMSTLTSRVVILAYSMPIWASLLAATGAYRELFTRVIYTEWLFFALMAAGLFILRRRPGYAPAYRTWGYPIVPVVFIVASLAIVVNQLVSEPKDAAIGLGMVAIGAPIYYLWHANRRLS